jgi:hypothetical protein
MDRTTSRTRTRLPEQLQRDALDSAANRRISMRIFALPSVIERQIEGQFFLGGGVEAEQRLAETLRQIQQKGGAS